MLRSAVKTPMRQAFLYSLFLVGIGVAIFAVLHFGSSLPLPGNAVSNAEPTSSITALEQSAVSDFLRELRSNVDQPLSRLFIQLLLILAAAHLVGRAFTRIGLSAVVGEMAAGILLGPSFLGLLAPAASAFVFPPASLGALQLLSQVGICLFMFSVGMDLNVRQVRGSARTAVAVSNVSIVVPFLFGVLFAYFLFTDFAGPRATFPGFALFMGISLSITAFPVLARILQERRMTQTLVGTTAVAAAALGDATAWAILAFVVAIVRSTHFEGAFVTVVLALVFAAVMWLGVRRALPRWLGNARLTEDAPSTGTLAAVLLVVIAASLCTELIGIHALFGAFVAGAVMPDADGFREKINARVQGFSSVLLLPLFFAFTGLRTQIGLLHGAQAWLLCLAIIAVATLGKLGASAAAARFTGMAWRQSLQLGALMNTRGLMELIALNIGYDFGILSPRIFAMLVIMALVTTLLTQPLLTLFEGRQPTAQPR
jgi:Kef-type K+ transport system membrane component KefB